MEGADGEDLFEWEALYLRLPVRNLTWNSTDWVPASWNVTTANDTWWDAAAPFDTPAAVLRAAVKAVVLGLLILATVIGMLGFNFIHTF